MRSDWVPLSASALVIGAMLLVLGTVLDPAPPGASAGQTFDALVKAEGRWQASAVMYALASFALFLGLPTLLTRIRRAGRNLGLAAVALFALGVIGTWGYAMLLLVVRAAVLSGVVQRPEMDKMGHDPTLALFLDVWVVAFYGGVLLLAVALLVGRTTPRWVPVLLVVFVVLLPVGDHLGRVGIAATVMVFAVAATGIATSAVSDVRGPRGSVP
jgi:hypothetical protein